MTKKGKTRQDDWARRLRELDEERDELLDKIESWKKECAERSAKPEEIDPLFCSREEPCEQTITFLNESLMTRKKIRETEDYEMSILFCAAEKNTCEPVLWSDTVTARRNIALEKKLQETDEKVFSKLSYYQRVRKYLSRQWQQVRTSFGM